jgi:hypothetical protein
MKIRPCGERIMRSCVAIGFATSVGIFTPVGFAQPSDPTVEREAQALLESAVELMQTNQFSPACRKLEVVLQKLPQATGARLELARCYRGEGRLASAWRQYVQVENLARIRDQKERVAEASKNATELARIVGKLQLDVPTDVASIAGLTITLDGQLQEPSSWGIPMAVDAMDHVKGEVNKAPVVVKVGNPSLPRTSLRIEVPLEIARIPKVTIKLDGIGVDLSEWAEGALIEAGSHDIGVSAPDYEPWAKQLQVQDGESAVITIPMLKRRSFPPQSEPMPPVDITPRKSPGFDKRAAGIVGIAMGGLSIGVGAILGGVAISRNRESDEGHCDADDFCDTTGYGLRSSALTLANASTATFIVGGVLVASGAILIAVSSPQQSSTGDRKAAVQSNHSTTKVWLGPTSVGIGYAW